mgnify:CR=1 FL=1
MFRKLENIEELRLKCQTRPEKVTLKLSKYLYRPISIYLTYIFLKLNISANMITFLSLIISFLGSYFIILDNTNNISIGLFCFWFFYLLDFCDGEVARYNKSNSLSGHFFELIAHYIVNILFFFSLAITFYLSTNNFYFLIFGVLGVIGDNLIKLKDAIIWQTICIENLRLTKRNDQSENIDKYEVSLKDTEENLTIKASTKKNKFFYYLKKNFLLSHFFANAIYLPFFLVSLFILIFSWSIIVLQILFIYTCIINILLGGKVIFDVLRYKKTEKTYKKFFNSSDKIDFNL